MKEHESLQDIFKDVVTEKLQAELDADWVETIFSTLLKFDGYDEAVAYAKTLDPEIEWAIVKWTGPRPDIFFHAKTLGYSVQPLLEVCKLVKLCEVGNGRNWKCRVDTFVTLPRSGKEMVKK